MKIKTTQEKVRDPKITCMFIISTILWDMQKDWELASRLTDIAVNNLIEWWEEYDVCKATVDWYLAGIGE